MYLPPVEVDELEFSMPESVALLYMPVTLQHAFLEGQRVSQLSYRGAQQLQRKLVWFYSGLLEDDLDVVRSADGLKPAGASRASAAQPSVLPGRQRSVNPGELLRMQACYAVCAAAIGSHREERRVIDRGVAAS